MLYACARVAEHAMSQQHPEVAVIDATTRTMRPAGARASPTNGIGFLERVLQTLAGKQVAAGIRADHGGDLQLQTSWAAF